MDIGGYIIADNVLWSGKVTEENKDEQFAFVSKSYTSRENGKAIDKFAVHKKNADKLVTLECLNVADDTYSKVCNEWSDRIFKVFDSFPRFELEK